MHEKQEKLINSFNSKLLAVRKVTQENQEKKTAGVDGIKNSMKRSEQNLRKKFEQTDDPKKYDEYEQKNLGRKKKDHQEFQQ